MTSYKSEEGLSPVTVVLGWAALNALLAALLAGFTMAGLGGGNGHGAGILAFAIYAAASCIVFLLALAVSASRRRARGQQAGLPLPSRPASALLLAAGVTLIWLGLAFGMWLPVIATVPLAAALGVELAARRSQAGSGGR
jgi:hypothetical protein